MPAAHSQGRLGDANSPDRLLDPKRRALFTMRPPTGGKNLGPVGPKALPFHVQPATAPNVPRLNSLALWALQPLTQSCPRLSAGSLCFGEPGVKCRALILARGVGTFMLPCVAPLITCRGLDYRDGMKPEMESARIAARSRAGMMPALTAGRASRQIPIVFPLGPGV
jgi:hypothetical protein